jgi:hypothetical protein
VAQGAARQVAWSRGGFLVGTSKIVELGVDPCRTSGPLRCKDAGAGAPRYEKVILVTITCYNQFVI